MTHSVIRLFLFIFFSQLGKAAYAIKRSTTIILLEWFVILKHMAKVSKERGGKPLSSCMIARDVETRWNYTYEMLSFTHIYRSAYNKLTANCDMGM